MKKRFFYSIWKFDKVEDKLVNLEASGWRLDRIKGMHTFLFVKSKPKTVNYFFTYSVPRAINMHTVDDSLKHDYSAIRIKEYFSNIFGVTSIYRISQQVDLSEQRIYRHLFLQHCLFRRIIYGLIFLLLPLIPLIIGMFVNPEKMLNDIDIFDSVILLVYFFTSIISLVYNIVGFIYLKKKKV